MNSLGDFGRLCVAYVARERWLLWLPVAMATGIASYFALNFEPSLWWLLASPLILAGCWFMRHFWPALVVMVVLLVCALGFNTAQIDTYLSFTPMIDKEKGPIQVTGRLMHTEVMPEGVRLTLNDLTIGDWTEDRTPVKLRIKLSNKILTDVPPTGSMINLWAQVGPLSEPVEPGANDFRRQSYFKQIGGLGWSFSTINLVNNPPPATWRDNISLMWERARINLAQHVYDRLKNKLSDDTAAMTAARLNGDQTAISKPVIEAMRIAGLAHLLSTSGFHVTIMGLLIYFPVRALLALIPWVALRFNIKKWAALCAIISAMGYTFLVGAQPATLRSLLMTAVAMLAILLDRRADPLRLVMMSAMLGMLIAPDALLGPSFQMSFAAVFCLIAAYANPFSWQVKTQNVVRPSSWPQQFLHYMWNIARTSLIATAATTPFAIYHFQAFSFYGFIANMLAIPLTSLWVMPCILMAYITSPFGLDGWFIDGAGAGIWVTIKIAQTVASWPYSIFYLPAMPVAVLCATVLGGLWLCLMRQNWRFAGLLPIALALFYPLYTPQPDFMVTADGKEWAARLDSGTLAVSNLDHDKFTIEQWQQRLGNIPALDVYELPDTENQLRCDDAGCVYRKGSHMLAMPILEAAALEDCEHADIVIAPFVIDDCDAETVIDDPEFWRHGAHALYFNGDDVMIKSVRTARAQRLWSPGWKAGIPL